jgi:hypothetical protein
MTAKLTMAAVKTELGQELFRGDPSDSYRTVYRHVYSWPDIDITEHAEAKLVRGLLEPKGKRWYSARDGRGIPPETMSRDVPRVVNKSLKEVVDWINSRGPLLTSNPKRSNVTAKKPSALAKLLGISQAKYDSLSPAQKIALIDKALPRADEATARKLRFSRQAIERWAKGIRPPKRNKAKPDKWIQRAVKKPGRLHTILGISQDKYDSLTKEQKLSRIAKALEKIEGVETKKAKSERGALLFAERAVAGGGFKKAKRNPLPRKKPELFFKKINLPTGPGRHQNRDWYNFRVVDLGDAWDVSWSDYTGDDYNSEIVSKNDKKGAAWVFAAYDKAQRVKRNPSEHKQVWDDAFVAGWKAAKRAKREVPPAKAYAKVDSAKYGIDWIDGYAAYADWKRGAYATANVKRAKSLGLTGTENPSGEVIGIMDQETGRSAKEPRTGRVVRTRVTVSEVPNVAKDKRTFIVTEYAGLSALRQKKFSESYYAKGHATADKARALARAWIAGTENPSSSATLTAAQKVTLVTAFTHIRKQATKVLPALAKVGLAVDSSIHDSPRHYAMTTATRSSATIYVAPEMAKLPKAQLDGVLMHEFGHAAVEMTGGHGSGSYDAKENKADRMAERLFGVKISYTSKGVETTGRGTRPRPAGLR